ncbi:hypothetical protein K3495_g6405 [Podosphaera aphanis]|nr:hypothetical protein K3495_g6405 [Podosphaera aphanis]
MELFVEDDVNSTREILSDGPLQIHLTTENNVKSSIYPQPDDILGDHQNDISLFEGSDPLEERFSPPSSTSRDSHLTLPPLKHQSAQSLPDLSPSSDYGDLLEYDELSELSATSQEMPPGNPRVVLNLTDLPTQTVPQTGKRRAESPTAGRPAKLTRTFSSESTKRQIDDLTREDIDVVDLREIENESQWQEKKAKDEAEATRARILKDAAKPIKLAEFQCIICMDSPTNLTVTHCGHLFCSECLHQALFAGDKKCCPVCRTIINLPKPGGRQTKNGVFALEMKLFTTKK